MKFVLNPSLEHMAVVKIVVSLWNQNDIRAKIARYKYCYLNDYWETIQERVIEKVPQLSLPQLLNRKVLNYIKPIGLEIVEWMEFHCIRFDFPAHLPAEFCWTPQGTIDRKRTAQVLVRCKKLDICTRYKLACTYCLEDDINKFWRKLNKYVREPVLSRVPIIIFWSHIMMTGGVGHTDYTSKFHQSAKWDNKAAAEYFLQKLSPQERERALLEAAKYVYKTDVLYFLLTEINEEQQKEVFKNNPYGVLRCFLQWPLQKFFIGIANRMWDFIPKIVCDKILKAIIGKVRDGFKDWNYQKLFGEFWQEIPSALKSLIIYDIDTSWLLPSLFHIKDKENIRLVLKYANVTVKETLIYSDAVNTLCECSIKNNEWDFLEFCIRECFPSKNDMLKFKERFEERVLHYSYLKEYFSTIKHKWDRVFLWSDDSNSKYDKRSLEEGESSSSKRFRCLQ